MQIKIKWALIQMMIYQMRKSPKKRTKTRKHLVSAEQIPFTGLITSQRGLKIKLDSENKHLNLKQSMSIHKTKAI